MAYTFTDTHAAQNHLIKKNILIILHDTTSAEPKTVTAICEELRTAVNFTVTSQRATALLRQMYHNDYSVCRTSDGMFYLRRKDAV